MTRAGGPPARNRTGAALLSILLLAGCTPAPVRDDAIAAAPRSPSLDADAVLTRIAFASCLDQDRPADILDRITAAAPDLLLMIGDNVYGDATGPALHALRAAYARQAASPALNRLRRATPVLAVWDDHDYGMNDGGADFAHRDAAAALFELFWHGDPAAERAQRPGVYHARTLGPPGRRTQVIMLDTRYFRSPLRATDRRGAPGRERYLPDPDPAKTLLGEAQWRWLEARLREPAELRLLVSSIQVIADGHGWEAWRTLPLERERLYDLIAETGANGVVILSGDRHRAGLYRLADDRLPYPLHEITSSSLNRVVPGMAPEAGPHRLGDTYDGANFGRVDVDWDGGSLTLRVMDSAGGVVRALQLDLAALSATGTSADG